MAITVKHKFVSAIPDAGDTTVVQPSNWNDDHQLTGTVPIVNGGTGASDAPTALTNLGAYPASNPSGYGTGTVTSVAATVPSFLNVTGSPITSNGTLAIGYSGTALPVANGGTGVSTSSGANSVVLRDANGNITTNCLFEGFSTQAASGTAIVLTASSVQNWQITGSGGQTIRLPNATTLPNGATFTFNNNQSSGTIVVQNNSSTTVATINSGGYVTVVLLDNSIAAGSWDRHDSTPSNVSWSTNTLDYPGSITSATWNGNAVAINRGGTGQTTASTAFNALSPLTTAGDTLYGGTSGAGTRLAIGTAGQVLTVNAGATAPQWSTPTTGTVTSVSGTGTVSGISLSGTVTSSGNLTLGGTLDLSSPPAIGGTTPAAGTFTTITGQTEVLKGTGSNLVLQSQALATTPWSATNIGTLTNNAAIAPDGTNTATSVISNTTSGNHYLLQAQSSLTFGVYTLSFYAKANGYTSLSITNSPNQYANFDLTNVVAAAGSGWTNATITSVGSGWYRCTVTSTNNSAWTNFSIWVTSSYAGSGSPATYAGNGTSGVYLWGVQTEEGNIANTYVPTTTTAIYGTPTLSFSGVAGLGLQSDGSLYVSPAGTGALQAQATTSSTVGGNARGANAVDWQTSRTAASQVASGQQSVIGGGLQNTASAAWGTVVGGYSNTASNTYVVAAGGDSNTASGNRSALVGGSANIAGGYLNFIGGGYGNSGTANAAVTTQSATMNGTTAVTLSGSNASIKVGQYITGTSIAFNTYVAAISGTSLTLSQAASGSSTSTLSFYTPHGVVVGGGNNQATGSYSFIGGGGDAGTAANRNVASGDWSFVGGGWKNTSLGNYSVIVGGNNNTNNSATNAYGFIGGGIGNTTSGFASMIVGGQGNLANSIYGSVLGSGYGTTRGITGYTVLPANNGATGAYNTGGAQSALLIVGAQTTTATSQVLTSDNAAAGTTNQVILPNNSAYYFKVSVIANVTGGGNTKAWTLEGAIKRGSGVGTAAIVGTVTTTIVAADVGAATWTVTATADTTNGGLAITFTGQASTTIRVVAQVQTTEVTY